MEPLKRLGVLALLALLAVLSGCAKTGTREVGSGRQFDVLTREEILSLEMTNLYDVVERARPQWLTRRSGMRSFQLEANVVVFQGQTMLGDVGALRELPPEYAYELRYLDGMTAAASLPGIGSQHVSGAIIIRTSPPEER
ncbi:MAG: hypothetical protein JSV86_03015 [Gemmatimonadota bacterium]|nr:MAG: hypothetical protein JSV86_03015 [Gemmatimonadota bacterium]